MSDKSYDKIKIPEGTWIELKEDGELMLKSLASPEDKEANKKYVKKLS